MREARVPRICTVTFIYCDRHDEWKRKKACEEVTAVCRVLMIPYNPVSWRNSECGMMIADRCSTCTPVCSQLLSLCVACGALTGKS